jgi:hypothetical protein
MSPRRSCHVVTCSRQSVRYLLNSRSARVSFSQVQRMFIVEHYLASRSYLTCQNEFKDTFSDSPVPNKSTISRLVKRFRDTGTLHRVASDMRKRVNACIAERGGHFQHLMWHWFMFSDFNVIYFLQIEHVSGMGCVTFRSPCMLGAIINLIFIYLFIYLLSYVQIMCCLAAVNYCRILKYWQKINVYILHTHLIKSEVVKLSTWGALVRGDDLIAKFEPSDYFHSSRSDVNELVSVPYAS